MQNDLDGLLGEVDLNLWDYGLLMKTGSSFGSLEAQYQALAHLVEVMKEALIEDTCPTYYLFQILVGQKGYVGPSRGKKNSEHG